MLKKTFTYVDYNGVERTEDHYFDLSEAEITEMELSVDGGLVEMINRIIAAKSAPAIVALFKDLILKAYGVKSPDGRRFDKSDKLREEFSHTKPYSMLFMELARDDKAAAAFVNGIIPEQKNN